jgi:hypothetical protein
VVREGRAICKPPGWMESFEIQAFIIQEEFLGGSWLVSSLVAMLVDVVNKHDIPIPMHSITCLF